MLSKAGLSQHSTLQTQNCTTKDIQSQFIHLAQKPRQGRFWRIEASINPGLSSAQAITHRLQNSSVKQLAEDQTRNAVLIQRE